jgi:hypothetical protein
MSRFHTFNNHSYLCVCVFVYVCARFQMCIQNDKVIISNTKILQKNYMHYSHNDARNEIIYQHSSFLFIIVVLMLVNYAQLYL